MSSLILSAFVSVAVGTARPIIGVLSVPIEDGCVTLAQQHGVASGGGATSCFHTLYTKWIESAGARVVPLRYDAPLSEIDALVGSINGILFTGGETHITDIHSTYMNTARHLLAHSVNASEAGETLPVWGTCMGMQTLSILVAEDPSVLLTDAFDSESLMLPLDLTAAASSSRLLGAKSGIPAPILADLTQRNVTTNLHHDGVAPEAFQENAKLAAFFTVVSTNKDRKGRVFVSTIEGKTAPVFGAQWHPERPQFEWAIAGARKDPINHSIQAVAAMQYMSNFFVAQARLNERTFATPAEEAAALIYNWQPVGTSSYQAFLFNPK